MVYLVDLFVVFIKDALLFLVKVGVCRDGSVCYNFVLWYARGHVPQQQGFVLHHRPDGLVGAGWPAVPDPITALLQ